jgi:hypothetical protein
LKSVAESLKSLKSLFTLTVAWAIARSPRLGILGSNQINMRLSGNHNKTENEIFSF